VVAWALPVEKWLLAVARSRTGRCGIDVVDERVIDMHLDSVEWDDWLHRATGATLFEFEYAEDLQMFEIRMDIGDIAINETGGLAHALGVVLGDSPDKLQAKRGEAVDEVVVTPELNHYLLIVLAVLVRLRLLNELQCVLTELFSVADGDVECRHDCLVGRCGQ